MTLHRRQLLAGTACAAAASIGRPYLARAQPGAGSVLRFIPSTPLPSLDPIVATSYVIRNHGYLDLRHAVRHRRELPDQAADGQRLADRARRPEVDLPPPRRPRLPRRRARRGARTASPPSAAGPSATPSARPSRPSSRAYRPEDARTFSIRLKQPFPSLTAALGKLSSNVPFIMPERIALPDASEADHRGHRLRALALRGAGNGCPARTRSTRASPATGRARRRPPGRPAARSPRSTGSSGSPSPSPRRPSAP